MTYCVDTSALIAAWSERYPIRRLPRFWERIDGLIADGRLVAPEDVRREIKKKEDGLFEWVNARKPMFVELHEPVQLRAKEILRRFPWLTKNLPDKSPADPFVIALALERGLIVVTQEARGGAKKPQIPFVCEEFGIGCIDLLGLLDREDWVLT
jgi:hypothetical protein